MLLTSLKCPRLVLVPGSSGEGAGKNLSESLLLSLPSPPILVTFCLLFLLLSGFVPASCFCICFSVFAFCLSLSNYSLFLSSCLFLPASLYLSLCFCLSSCLLSPSSTPSDVSSLSVLHSVFLGLSLCLCRLTYPVSLPPTFVFVGCNSLQTLVSGCLLAAYMEISAGGPLKRKGSMASSTPLAFILMPPPPGVSEVLFCPDLEPGALFCPHLLTHSVYV